MPGEGEPDHGLALTAMEQCIGNTRLLRLRGPSERTGCDIYGKVRSICARARASLCGMRGDYA